jgi:ABC-2 type transport system permease protein
MAVRTRVFVRLKLRLLRNSFRGAGWRKVLAVLGILGGLWFAVVGFMFFSLSGVLDGDDGFSVAVLGGAGVALSWIALPLLAFGVDETLDPSRFALLPMRRRVLLRGLFAAALLGIPAVATLLATQGIVLGAAVRGGPSAAAVAFVGTVLGLLLCVAASRAVTSALSTALRSRRFRDAAMLLFALLAAGLGPLQLAGISVVQALGADRLLAAARVVAWTPLGAPYAIGLDVAAGRWGPAAARLLIVTATIGLLLRWWAATLPAAMLGGSASVRASETATAGGGLVPAPLRGLRSGRFAGILARELRYWWRDPRRRSGLVSVLVVAIVLPLVYGIGLGGGLTTVVLISGAMVGTMLANLFGFDGSAYTANVLVGVPGRVEVAARIGAISVVVLPPVGVAAAVAGAIIQDGRTLSALGVALCAYGVSAGLSVIVSVLVPYALPESSNPFAMNAGTGGMRGLAAFGPMLAAAALAAPLALVPLPAPVTLVAGLVVGGAAVAAGILIAGGRVDERAPEILLAVTPRR